MNRLRRSLEITLLIVLALLILWGAEALASNLFSRPLQ